MTVERKGGERIFGGSYSYVHVAGCLSPLRKLDGVIMRLKPLSEQHALLGFLRNVDNTKSLTGFVQELSDAITDYQV